MSPAATPRRWRVVVAHNAYQQRGGEDAVVDAEVALLRQAGHEVIEYRRHNDEIHAMGRTTVLRDTFWSPRTARDLARLLQEVQPDLVHAHNTFPLISPALYDACAEQRVPVVQTLHNFRLACPNGTLMRDGRPCEDCVGQAPWRAVVHRCYRDSRLQSAVLAGSLVVQRRRGAMHAAVRRYIALSEFSRGKFVSMGLPADRIDVKPNFVALNAPPPDAPRHGLLYVGRLSPEKGIDVLARALALAPEVPVRIAGDGPQAAVLDGLANAERLGALAPATVAQAMATTTALLLPSVCYEGFPRVLAEAFACGTPVIASRIGALAELVEHGVTGLLVAPGDANAWAETLAWAHRHPEALAGFGQRARERFETAFSAQQNLPQLLDIYARACTAEAPRPAV